MVDAGVSALASCQILSAKSYFLSPISYFPLPSAECPLPGSTMILSVSA